MNFALKTFTPCMASNRTVVEISSEPEDFCEVTGVTRRRPTPANPILVEDLSEDDLEIVAEQTASRPLSLPPPSHTEIAAPGRTFHIRDSDSNRPARPFASAEFPSTTRIRNPRTTTPVQRQRQLHQRQRQINVRSRQRLSLERSVRDEIMRIISASGASLVYEPPPTHDYDLRLTHNRVHGDYLPEGRDVESGIMDMIQQNEERENDSRVRHRKRIANQERKKHEEKAALNKKGSQKYTHTLEEKSKTACELCGTILGEGIPQNYTCNHTISTSKNDHRFQAPWQLLESLTEKDTTLSRKTFFGRCGHVYCGRCIHNIFNLDRRKLKRKPPENSTDIDMKNAATVAPRICPAENCGHKITKRFFTEIFY